MKSRPGLNPNVVIVAVATIFLGLGLMAVTTAVRNSGEFPITSLAGTWKISGPMGGSVIHGQADGTILEGAKWELLPSGRIRFTTPSGPVELSFEKTDFPDKYLMTQHYPDGRVVVGGYFERMR